MIMLYQIRQESSNRLVAGFFEVIETIEEAEKVLKYFQDRIEEKLIIVEIDIVEAACGGYVGCRNELY